MSKKIGCGGFRIDNDTLKLKEDGTLYAAGGSIPKPLTYDYMPEGYPKKDGWSIEWDGNTEGKLYIPTEEGVGLYKISDMVLSADDLLGATFTFPDHPGETITITSDRVDVMPDDIIMVRCDTIIVVVRKDNATLNGVTFQEKGVYTFSDNDKFRLSKKNITPMSNYFMPKNFNVVFRAATGNVPTSCNVTYDELRGWVTNGIPVLAVLNIGNNHEVYILGHIVIGKSYIVFGENSSSSTTFKYNSDGTFSENVEE